MTQKKTSKKITKTSLQRARRILAFMKPYLPKYYLGLMFLFFTGLTALAFPKLLGYLVDSVNGPVLWGLELNEVAFLLLVILVLQAVFSFFRVYLFTDVTESTLMHIRQNVYGHLLNLPMAYFSSESVGELSSRISSDITQLRETFRTTLAEFLRQFMISIGGVILLAFTSPKLTGMILLIVPVVALSAVFFGRFIRSIARDVQDDIALSNKMVIEGLQGIANVKAFVNEQFEKMRYNKVTSAIQKKAVKGGLWSGSFASFIILCMFGAIVVVMWYAMVLVESKEMSYGDMISFLIISVFIGASIGGIAELYSGIQKALGATERLLDILDETIEPVEENTESTLHINGEIQFDGVEFSYPSRPEFPVIKNMSFHVREGEQIALVGTSGSGKTTITSLLMRFYDPIGGSIQIDGKPAQHYPLHELRKQIGIVPQDILLFSGTIKENIAYGKPGASDEEIQDAAEKANAIEFINGFPEGFETIVGERGIMLSGGQRQRIAIARAILKDPAILLLDEATSSLDSNSEKLVQEALDFLMQGRTTFIIAHRLATIRNVHKILVIQDGEIVESGNHEELSGRKSGLYHELSTMQFRD